MRRTTAGPDTWMPFCDEFRTGRVRNSRIQGQMKSSDPPCSRPATGRPPSSNDGLDWREMSLCFGAPRLSYLIQTPSVGLFHCRRRVSRRGSFTVLQVTYWPLPDCVITQEPKPAASYSLSPHLDMSCGIHRVRTRFQLISLGRSPESDKPRPNHCSKVPLASASA